MAWIFRTNNTPTGPGTNSVVDYFDSMAAGFTGNTPATRRRQ